MSFSGRLIFGRFRIFLSFLRLFFLEQSMVMRTFSEHLRTTARASFFLTEDAAAVSDLFATLRTNTEAASPHFISALHCHESQPRILFTCMCFHVHIVQTRSRHCYFRGTSMTAPRPPSMNSSAHSSRNMRMALSPVQWLGATFLTPSAFNRLIIDRISASLLPPR